MRLLFLLLIAGGALAVPIEEDLPSLYGAKVFSLTVETEKKLSAILALRDQRGYDIIKYTHVLGKGIHLLVTADKLQEFESLLLDYEIDSIILTENVQPTVDQKASLRDETSPAFVDTRNLFTNYQRYDTIVLYLAGVAANRSDIASLINIGRSHEGRIIYGLKISSGGNDKPAILIEGALHAREWISPSTILFFINEFVEETGNSDLFENVDWYFIPVLNPDGYEFTFTDYRLWRKTRKANPGSSCRGTDPNRNFDYQWMVNGASLNPCSDAYAGTEAFSELETQALRDFIMANRNTIKLYLTYHSYGNYFLYPWSHTSELPDDSEELRILAEAAEQAQATFRGTRYTVGNSYDALYAAAGVSDDWVKAVGGVELSYTVELPGGGLFGFDIPPSEIIPVGQESFLALRVFGEYIAKKFTTP